jgi:putrescine aminotransferase
MTGIAVRNPAVESGITMLLGKRGVHAGHSMNEHARHPVLRFYPPLTVTEEEIDILLTALDETLQRLEQTGTIMLDLLNVIATRQYALPKSILRKAGGRKPSTAPTKMLPANVNAGQPTTGGR